MRGYMGKKTYLLVDGHYEIHRVLHIPRLATLKAKDGTPSGGVFGFLRILFATAKAPQMPSFDKLIVAWDRGSSPRRREIFPGYRVRPPQDEVGDGDDGKVAGMDYGELFIHQKKIIHEWVKAMGAASIEFKKREADDIIYKMTDLGKGSRFIIVSDDKDFLQLVSPDVHVFRPMAAMDRKAKDPLDYVTPATFGNKFGFKPSHYLLYKALTGDSSDMVPGVKGIGDVTAAAIAADCKKAKHLKRYADHKVARMRLAGSKECRTTVERNMELFDLSREKFDDDQIKVMQKALDKPVKIDWGTLRKIADEMNLDTVTSNLGRWMDPFRGNRK